MGIPSFYGWLIRRFPAITASAEPGGCSDHGYDNLYLDMNSIIHLCFHPGIEEEQPTTFSQVFDAVASYIDKLVDLVQPRRLLYLAVDGVAPRAKMNQQRARRFVAAKVQAEAASEEKKLRVKYEEKGKSLPAEMVFSEVSDSNVITPGTKFMAELSIALQQMINVRLETSPAWKELQVVLSDASVPGEGEHKIMNFIRWRKYYSGVYDADTSHCLYGADADLILLALASHEQNFSILREAESDLVFLHLQLLRDRLRGSMMIERPPFEVDFKRVVDDFVFMCCLVGNDFIPHIPTLLINDGAIDSMMNIYTTQFWRMGDYLTCNGQINMPSVAHLFEAIAANEEAFLKKKYKKKKRSRRNRKRRTPTQFDENYEPEIDVHGIWENPDGQQVDTEVLQEYLEDVDQVECNHWVCEENSREQALEIGSREISKAGEELSYLEEGEAEEVLSSEGSAEEIDESEQERNLRDLRLELKSRLGRNNVRIMTNQHKMDKTDLGLPGWKMTYYSIKLDTPEHEVESLKADMVQKYLEGLTWILAYYYHGVPSWQWYYPYHYAPFASDFVGIASYSCHLDLGKPLKPLQQLLAVLPPQSANALPESYQKLMLDPMSPIADFYPSDLSVDYSGVKKAWQGVVKLPFVDERRLIAATEPLLLVSQSNQTSSSSA